MPAGSASAGRGERWCGPGHVLVEDHPRHCTGGLAIEWNPDRTAGPLSEDVPGEKAGRRRVSSAAMRASPPLPDMS